VIPSLSDYAAGVKHLFERFVTEGDGEKEILPIVTGCYVK